MFTALDNKLVGQNIAKLRRHRDIKAAEMASRLELSESAYTKYERGETSITVDFLNKIAEQFEISPAELLNATPQTIVENIHDSNVAVYSNENSFQNIEQTRLLTTAVESLIEQQKALIALFEKLGNKL
ncbi:helix-turn-helix domain-containing protein [Chitinophagaceae bacterium MMS25-I14]